MKRALNRTLSMVLVAGLAGAPAMNAFAADPPAAEASPDKPPAAPGIQALSKQELKELADYGARHGEDVADLRAYAEGKDQQRGFNIFFKIARKALVLTIKKGGPALVKSLKGHPRAARIVGKSSSKVIKALEKLDNAEEKTVHKVLTEVGFSRQDADAMTPWIAFMLP